MTSWHTVEIGEAGRLLARAEKRRAPNRLVSRETVRWPVLLARQFTNMMVAVLAVAAFLSLFAGDRTDALAILAIILLNGALGFVQEWKAETALANLKKMLAPRCRVLRDGRALDMDAESLVPGDRVLLSPGDAVPADLLIASSTDLRADESALTGESAAVAKAPGILAEDAPLSARSNMAFMGTHIVNGHAEGLVVATGMDTEFGRIAGLTGTIGETQTRLQRQLAVLARQLGALALSISLAVVAAGLFDGRDVMKMLMTGISLAVAAVPEGLPAAVTITLALGAGAMARRKALLRRLQAAETLGAVSVICTDKTGTLTKNEMTVQKIWLASGTVDVGGAGYEPEGDFRKDGRALDPRLDPDLTAFLDTGRTCNRARLEKGAQGWRAVGTPTEAALIAAAMKAGLGQDHGARVVAEYSFSSARKRMAVVAEADGVAVSHVKGAPEVVLPLCTHALSGGAEIAMTHALRARIAQAYAAFAQEGLRTLLLARRTMPPDGAVDEAAAESGLVFLGVAGVIDPPRPEVPAAIEKARRAGIRVTAITGDSPGTALAVARRIGLPAQRAVTGAEIADLDDAALSDLLRQDVLFARTVPEDKYRIVRLLQAQGQLVAMTGDGVNDAPALKQADVGIAMGIRGTDVARGAADIVLTDDNFATIVAAVEEGRRQYANIRKFVQFLAAHSVCEVSAVFFNILSGGPLILLPVQILWINIATDSVTALALGFEKAEPGIMEEPPRAGNRPILDRATVLFLALLGGAAGALTLGLFRHYLEHHSYETANAVALTTVVVTAQVLAFNFRNLGGPLSLRGWFSNPWLLAAVAAMTAMQAAAVYFPPLQAVLHTVPLSGRDWAVIIGLSLPLFAVPEAFKIVRRFLP